MGIENLSPLDNEEAGAKAAEISDEVFRERIKKAQKTQKALKKAEGKARAKDDRLAKVIGKFLQTRSNAATMLLISRCLNQNIPAGFILGILALIETEAQKEFEATLGEASQLLTAPKVGNRALVAGGKFPPKIKSALDGWSFGLLEFGLTLAQPTHLLATTISPEGKLFSSLRKLTAFVLRDFFEEKKLEIEFRKTEKFAEFILRSVLEKIKIQLDETRKLKEKES